MVANGNYGETSWRNLVAEPEAQRIVAEIDSRGYGTLCDCVSEQELQPLREIARAAVREAKGEAAYFVGLEAFAGTVLGELAGAAAFNDLCRRLYELTTGEAPPPPGFYLTFRCLRGISGQLPSRRFHYDAHFVTALLPVEIPEEAPNGDLLMIPGSRPKRRFYLSTLVDKIAVGNGISQAMLRRAAGRGRGGIVAVPMRPGTIYFFLGYRSLHTNEACRPDRLRATALFHYGDPHWNSPLSILIRTMMRARREN